MKRLTTALIGLFVLAAGSPAWAQDEVTYYDRTQKRETKATGTIQAENPGRLTLKSSTGGTKEVPVIDILDVVYNIPPLIKQDYNRARARESGADKATKEEERKKELASALGLYQDLVGKVADAKAKRHMEFKVAKLLARQAEEDPAQSGPAMEKLIQFKKNHPDSWQISASSELLARLQMDKKDWASAQATYEDLAKTANISPDIIQDANLKIAQVLVHAKKYDVAEAKLQELEKAFPADSPQAIRLQMARAESQAASGKSDQAAQRLEALIPKLQDPDMKALAYNTLGDCHRLGNRPKDALWDYLWVEVKYHQNRQEHAKALYYISKLFKELKDEKRAQQYKEKLESKEFAGLEYQKLIVSEK
jgi:TolA-binding protein